MRFEGKIALNSWFMTQTDVDRPLMKRAEMSLNKFADPEDNLVDQIE